MMTSDFFRNIKMIHFASVNSNELKKKKNNEKCGSQWVDCKGDYDTRERMLSPFYPAGTSLENHKGIIMKIFKLHVLF